jgi:hypothetical protein
MTVPLDAIRAIHNAFRKDIAMLDGNADSAAHGHGNLDVLLGRYQFLNEILVWHAVGEEKYVFPAVEKVTPLVSEPYEKDHRGLDSLHQRLSQAVGSRDLVEVARATAALRFHLDFHLDKEEAHLYRIVDERIPVPEQAAIGGKMAGEIPRERFAESVKWLFPLIGADDRENMARIWQQSMPPAVFVQVVPLIKSAVGEGWKELVRRMPELNEQSAGRA